MAVPVLVSLAAPGFSMVMVKVAVMDEYALAVALTPSRIVFAFGSYSGPVFAGVWACAIRGMLISAATANPERMVLMFILIDSVWLEISKSVPKLRMLGMPNGFVNNFCGQYPVKQNIDHTSSFFRDPDVNRSSRERASFISTSRALLPSNGPIIPAA